MATKKKTNITNKVKKVIDKKKKEVKKNKLKSDIKKTIEKGVKTAKTNSAKTLDALTNVGFKAKEKAKVASSELTKASNIAKTSAKKYLEIGKIKAENVIINANINKAYEKIGMIIYRDKIDIDNDDIKQLMTEIDNLKLNLKQILDEKDGK